MCQNPDIFQKYSFLYLNAYYLKQKEILENIKGLEKK
jgi:hypothetical protein